MYMHRQTDHKLRVAMLALQPTNPTLRVLWLLIQELESTHLPCLALLPYSHQDEAGYIVRGHHVSSPEQ